MSVGGPNAKRYGVLVRLARRALEGAPPEELARELPDEVSDAESFLRALHEPDASGDVKDEVARELVELVRDVARRRAVDSAALERHRAIFEHSSDGIYLICPEGRYLDVNPRGCEMFGYSRAELLTMRIYDLVPPGEPPVVLERIQRESIFLRRRRLRHKDGHDFIAEIGARRLPDGDVLAIVRDVTDQEATAAELRLRTERFRQALRAARAGAWEWAVTGETFWSDEQYELLGLDPGTTPASYEAWIERVHPEDRAAIEAEIARALEQRSNLDMEMRVVRADGVVRWARNVGQMVFGPDGAPAAIYGINLDITEAKEVALARAEAEKQLAHAQRMEALGRLAGGIAHDFNNLLTVILTAAHMAAAGLPPGARAEHLEAVLAASTRGAALTRQLLALSRHQPFEARALDLDAQVTRMAPVLRRLLGEEITIRLELHGELPLVRADPSQLDQVLLNLAVNAREAMSRGGTLTFGTAMGGGETVVLSVTDTGTGIDEETRARIFEPFFTTRPASGTGLGLAMVYGIVVRGGGRIDVESPPEGGTRFVVRLPTTGPDEEPVEVPEHRAAVGPARVLVVEDEAPVRALVRRALESAGHAVVEAGDAPEALARVAGSQEPFDLLLTDVVLPTMSGPELAARIGERGDLRVLYMSGYLGDSLVQRGLPFDGALLEKPFTPAALLDAVRRALGSS